MEFLYHYMMFSLGIGFCNAWQVMEDEYNWQPFTIGWRECLAFVAIGLVSALSWPLHIFFVIKDSRHV